MANKPLITNVFQGVRTLLEKPDEVLYMLHTPVGAIAVRRTYFQENMEYVFVDGFDENDKYRFLGFPEAHISTFPVELKQKPSKRSKGSRSKTIGFKVENSVDVGK